MIFKVEAGKEVLYIRADSKDMAVERLVEVCGEVPTALKFTEVKEVPKGADVI
jgi:hypothetical protein